MRSIKKIFFMIFCVGIFLPLYSLYAAESLVPCGTGDDPNNACTICDLTVGIDRIITFIMGVTTIIAIAIIVVAGIMYIVSAGNPGLTTMAKAAVKNTIIGVVVILSAFILIHFILRAIAVQNTGSLTGVDGNTWSFNCGT